MAGNANLWDTNWSLCHLSLLCVVLWPEPPRLVLLAQNVLRNKVVQQGHVAVVNAKSLSVDGTQLPMNILREYSLACGAPEGGYTLLDGLQTFIIVFNNVNALATLLVHRPLLIPWCWYVDHWLNVCVRADLKSSHLETS